VPWGSGGGERHHGGERSGGGERHHGREGSGGGEARDWVRETGEQIATGGGERWRLEKGSDGV